MEEFNDISTGEEGTAAGDVSIADSGEQESPPPGDGEVQPPDDISAQIEAFKSGMRDERAKRQRIEGQLQMMQQMLYQQQQGIKQDEVELSPDDMPTVRDMEKLIAKKLGEQVDPKISAGMEMLVKMSDNLARQRYEDYDTAIGYFQEYLENDQSGKLRDYVLGQSDPAEAAYRFGMTHPRYSQTKNANGNKNIAKQIKKNMSSVQTLSDAGGAASSTKNAIKAIEDMSFDEINAEIDRIMQKG